MTKQFFNIGNIIFTRLIYKVNGEGFFSQTFENCFFGSEIKLLHTRKKVSIEP